jgi:hypothetical protein
MVIPLAAIRTTLRLEGAMQLDEIRSETEQHILYHVIRTNTDAVGANLRGDVSISDVPCKPHELNRYLMAYFDNRLGGSPDFQPPAVFKLQTVSVRDRNGFGQVEEDIFSLVDRQEDTTAVAGVEIERDGAGSVLLGPRAGDAVNRSVQHRQAQYRK